MSNWRRRSEINKARREANKPEVLAFCEDAGFSYRWMAGDWHMRIENVMDIYPTRKRFFWLPTKEWGEYSNYDDLGKIMIERMETNG